MHFRICLRDFRNEPSLEDISNGIGHCISLRKLDISFSKYLRDVSFTKDIWHLEELCMDQCQSIRPPWWTCAFRWNHVSCSSCVLMQKSWERCSYIAAATGRRMLEQAVIWHFYAMTLVASVSNFTEWYSIVRDFHDTSFGNDLLFSS